MQFISNHVGECFYLLLHVIGIKLVKFRYWNNDISHDTDA